MNLVTAKLKLGFLSKLLHVSGSPINTLNLEKKMAALKMANVPTFPHHQMASLLLQPRPHPGVVNIFILKKVKLPPMSNGCQRQYAKIVCWVNLSRELIYIKN